MTDISDDFLQINIDADNYADAAAEDEPAVPRTFQSEADFQAQKTSYTAKVNYGNTLAEMLTAIPVLVQSEVDGPQVVNSRPALDKKQAQLIGYAVGELYYDRKYKDIINLCEQISLSCETDHRVQKALHKWRSRCHEKLEAGLEASPRYLNDRT